MLRKWNRILSFILAVALIATTFHSDIATIRVFAEDDFVQDDPAAEPVQEPVVEEAAEEEAEPEYVEPETPAPENVEGENPGAAPETEVIQDSEPTENENIEGEPAVELEEEKELTEEELAELAEKEAKEAAEKEAAEKAAEKKPVAVSYKASLGGQVSISGETIDINDEEAKFEGATATAVNKYYQFVAWVDADGNTVCSEATFIPSNIEEDATFTANFMKLSEMPAQSFSGSAGGMNVSVSADEGIFPEGTTMNVSAISDDEALDAAKDAVGESAQQAKGVDITFRNADGEEIEPADARYVHVSISLSSELEGESFSVVHKDDAGNSDVIASASASGAEFEANQFSVYIVVGTDGEITDHDLEIVTQTYVFMSGDTEVRRQVIKNGEELENPGIPELGDNQEFKGWFYKEGNAPVEFGIKTGITQEKTIECYAKIETTFYLTFIGVDGEVVQVKSKVVVGDEPAEIETGDVKVDPAKADQAHRGWSVTEGGTECKAVVDARVNDTVYAVVMDAYWITFVENDGDDHGGASYTGPVSVFADQLPKDVKPAPPTRRGYSFGGWYKEQGSGDGQVVGPEFNWNEELTEDTTLYAKWTPNTTTEYTINIWQQKISDSKTITNNGDKHYDFKESYTLTGTTGAHLSEASISGYKNKGDEGFHYQWFEIVRNKDGVNVPTDEIRAKGDTVINVYYDRDYMNIIFKTYKNRSWSTYKELTGLYGQPITFYEDYSWPSEYDWYSSYSGSSGSGTRLTFLDAFLFKGLSGISNEGKTLTQYASNHSGSNIINFYLQNIDDSWPKDYEDQMKVSSGATFTVTDKYNGFTAYSYSYGDSDNWTTFGPRNKDNNYGSYSVGNRLNIRFTRNKYNITLKSNFQGNVEDVTVIENIPYGANIADYQGQAPTLPDKPGYRFKGWYEDLTGGTPFVWSGTMPAANKIIYGCYEVKTYHVSLNADGGNLIEGQKAEFDVDYGTIIERSSLEKTTKDGYQLVGWYEGDKPYDYREVDSDVTLTAKWRNPGTVKVEYDATELGTNPPTDTYDYATNSTVVVGAPPKPVDGYTFVGWTIVGDEAQIIYYPNGCFEIISAYIIDGKVTLKAQYIKTGGEGGLTTFIKYHANDGSGRTKEVAVNADGDDLLVNEKIIALTVDEAGFTRSEEYEFKGWSKTPGEDNTVDIPAGSPIAADNNGIPEANNLYAVWELVMSDYVIEYYKGKIDSSHRIFTTDPIPARIGTSITLNATQLNAKKPRVGYQDGVQDVVPYVIKKNQANIIKVLYKPIQITVTVEGTQVTKVYDGNTYTATGYTVTSITPDVGYKAEYVGYSGNLDVSATHVSESKEILLDKDLFQNTSNLFDNDAVTFVIGSVKSNKVTITPATLTIETPTETKTYDGTPLTAEGTISGFVNNETATFETTGTVTYPSEGKVNNSYTLTWDGSAKESDYTVSETVGTLQVFENTAANITIITVGGTHVYDGQYHGAEVTVEGLPEGYVVAEAASSAKAKDVAESPMEATADVLVIKNGNGEDVTDKLSKEFKNDKITITPAPITIVTPTASKVYDGTPLTAEGTMEGLVNNETATFTTIGSQTKVGSSENKYSLVWDGTATESNYEIKSESIGTLTVTENETEIVVTTTGGEFTYDGTAHGAEVTVSELPKGYRKAEAASSAKATDVTTTPVKATADILKIVNEQGDDVTDQLTITYVNGEIVVKPATLTIITNDASKVYDGDPLIGEGSIDGFVNNETATFKVTGAITEVGEVPNKYELTWNGTAKESNYKIEETIGTLEVTKFAGTITITTVGEDVEYDGQVHGAEVTVEGLPKGYTVEKAVSNATALNYTKENVPADCDELVILNSLGEDVTADLAKEFIPGFIRIRKAPVTVTIVGNNKTVKYNGYEQEVKGYEVTEISHELYTEDDMSFAGDAIAKGKLPDTYDMGLDKGEKFSNKNDNFDVKFEITDGYLTIEPLGPGEKFRIYARAYDAEREYTGEFYEGFGYELTGEGPTQGFVSDAIDKVADIFRSAVRGIIADAADGEGDPTVTINGKEYTVKGLYVPTKARNAGDYELPIEGEIQVFDGQDDVTGQFELVERTSGTLTINPMVITLTSGSATKAYDGRPLTNSTITADKDWGKGDSVRYDITGSQTAVGSSPNTFVAVALEDTDFDTNYRINYIYGTLRVTDSTPPGGGTTITDDPTPTAPTPTPAPPAAVLGATRETDGAAVLGARRGRTEDNTNQAGRIMAILVAAAVAAALLLFKKKEEEDQK